MAKVGRMLKEGMTEEFTKRLSECPNLLVTRVDRLTASDASNLRKQLHSSDASFVLVKRRIGVRVLEKTDLSSLNNLLEGSVGIVLPREDVVSVAKLLVEFRKAHEGQLAIRGAFIEGQLLNPDRVEDLARLPAKPILLAHVVAAVESTMSDVIWTVERLVGDVAWIIEQAAEKKPSEPAQDERAPETSTEVKEATDAKPTSDDAKEPKVEETKKEEPKGQTPDAKGPSASAEGAASEEGKGEDNNSEENKPTTGEEPKL